MPNDALGEAIRHICTRIVATQAGNTPDRQLLDRFLTRQEEAAFEALLRRHGPMVLAVCHRVLRNTHDAEEAFQAAFLVFARKAHSIRESLPHWLHGVAYHTALRLKTKVDRRRRHERQAALMPKPEATSPIERHELQELLDEELCRLPEKYRTPLILCHLEGKTHDEAAKQLGWPVGTVSGRLSRACEVLRTRLTRRGLALPAGLFATALAESAVQAALPVPLIVSTVKAAGLIATGQAVTAGLVSTQVVALAKGVTKAMVFSKLKVAAMVLAAVGLIGTGTAGVAYRTLAAGQQDEKESTAPTTSAKQKKPEKPEGVRTVIAPDNAAQLQEVAQIDKDVREIEWSKDGKQLAFVYWERPVEVLDSDSLKVIRTIGDDKQLIHFVFSPDGETIAYCTNSTKAEILNTQTGNLIDLQTENPQPAMKFSPDGKLLVTGGYGTSAKAWCTACGHLVRSFEAGEIEGGLTAAFSPDGKLLAIGNRNSTTRIFETKSGKLLHILGKMSTQGLKFDPSGAKLAVCYVDGSLGLWDLVSGTQLKMIKTEAEELYKLDWSPDGKMLATVGLKGKISLWKAADLTLVKELDAPEWVIAVRFSPDGTRLLTAGGEQGLEVRPGARKVQIWGVMPKGQ